MKNSKALILSACVLFSILACNHSSQAQKQILNIEDAMMWRNHSVALSNNGNWYTILYSLSEKPDPKQNLKKDSAAVDTIKLYNYGEDLKTDTLYICNSETGVKYRIPKGSSPQFSDNSEWIAYKIITEADPTKKDAEPPTIELKNLLTGHARQFKSKAGFQFTEGMNYFISSDKNSLLIYDLENNNEHFIGSIGEYLIDKKTKLIAYTISSTDKRGNGIYIYNPEKMTTKAIETGNSIYTNLSWNQDNTGLAAIAYSLKDKKVDFKNTSIILISDIKLDKAESTEFTLESINGMPDSMSFAVNPIRPYGIKFSNDNERLFVKIKEYDPIDKKTPPKAKVDSDKPTVDVWHWKDDKLLSQRMKEAERTTSEIYDAIFFPKSKKIIQLTSKELQRMVSARDTDSWAIGYDNRKYISDWDVRKNDLYRINLETGEKNLIEEKYSGPVDISPDGKNALLWIKGHFWHYDIAGDTKNNITENLVVSFINLENDHWGSEPSYGIVGWVKGQNAVIVNHKLNLWLLPFDNKGKVQNITNNSTAPEDTRFRIDDMSFRSKPEIDERYIDLDSPLLLNVFNLKTKHSGYFQLDGKKLKQLIYEPASFSASRYGSGVLKAKYSDIMIYKKGDYMNYPESYLSDINFSRSKKLTTTNPQQEKYNWGNRILIDYTNDDGEPLQGILSIPDTYSKGDKLPMVVYSYEKMSQNMYSYSSPRIGGSGICEMMYVSDGYLVLLPDIHFNVGTPHSDMHECIDAAIEKVIELGYVDEKSIGYEGFSYGGHCGMYISTQENKFAAIAAGAGVSNLVQGFNIDIVRDGSNEQDYYMTGQGRLGTDPVSNTEMYISESAVFNANTMNTPLLLFHGTIDNVVQWEHSFGFYSILRYLKKPVVFLSYKGEGHGLRQKGNRIDIQSKLKEYFDHYLKGKDGGKWITEGLPYEPEEKAIDPKAKPKVQPTLPKWR